MNITVFSKIKIRLVRRVVLLYRFVGEEDYLFISLVLGSELRSP